MDENTLYTPDHTRYFHSFRQDLCKWSYSGEEPGDGDAALRSGLTLQQQRLQQLGLQMTLELEPFGRLINLHQVNSRNALLKDTFLSKYTHYIFGQPSRRTVCYYGRGRCLHREKKSILFYETIYYPNPRNRTLPSTPYSCPGCGAVTTLGELTEGGCPYCGSHFEMPEFFPKVCNYFSVDGAPSSPDILRKDALKLPLMALVLGLVWFPCSIFWLFSQAGGSAEEFVRLLSGASYIFTWYLAALFCLLPLMLLGRLFLAGFESSRVILGSARSKDRLAEKLGALDPCFSYVYFEAKALSLSRILLFREDPTSCVQYEGRTLGRKFRNVIDLQYRGGMKLRSIRKTGENILVKLDVFVTLTRLKGNRIREEKRKLHLTLRHRADFPTVSGFTIRRVQCGGCSGSFDAGIHRVCPYCGKAYDPARPDWVVTELH